MNERIGQAEIEALLARHRAFWERGPAAKPLVHTYPHQPLEDIEIRIPLADGRFAREGEELTPEKIDPRRSVGVEWASGQWVEEESPRPIAGDLFVTRAPFDICWMEAIMGCRVYFSSRARWSEEYLADWEKLEEIRPAPDNKWLGKLLEFTQALQEASRGRYLVCNPLMRGPIDMAAAVVGENALCMALYDRPEELRRLLQISTEVTIEVFQKLWGLIPPFHGGWCTSFGIWAPGTVGYTQIDASELFSPSAFREAILPHYRRLFRSRDYVVIHTHSISRRHIEALLEREELCVVQISIDPPPAFGPNASELLPVFRRVQEGKPLLITGPVTEDELKLLLDSLSPRGLALNLGIEKMEVR